MNKFNFRSRKPRYNDDSDYTTNAPSYYDDLARKNQLIKYLAKRIWEYEKTLHDSLEEIENILNEYINVIDGKIELIDHVIGEGFNDRIEILLREWVNDGTLNHIINEEIFNELNNDIQNFKNEVKDDISEILFNVKLFGAKGDGVTDDTEAIKNAINTRNKTFLHFPKGEYRITENILFNDDVTIIGDNSTIILDGNISMRIEGEVYQLETNFIQLANEGDDHFYLMDTSDIKKGDVLILTDTDDFSFSQYRSYYYDGEFVEVMEVDGSKVIINGSLQTSYDIDVNYKVYKMNGVTADISDLTIKKSDDTKTGDVLYLQQVINSSLKNVTTENGNANDSLFIRRAYNLVLDQVNVKNTSNNPEHFGYGVVIRASQDISIYDSKFYARRHASAVGSESSLPSPITRNLNFYNCTFTSFSKDYNTSAADFHGSIKNGYYHNCIFYGGVVLAGEDVGVYGGKSYTNNTQAPLTQREIKGGRFEFKDITCVLFEDQHVLSYHSSSELDKIDKNINYVFDNLDIIYKGNKTPSTFFTIDCASINGSEVSIFINNIKANKTPNTQFLHLLSGTDLYLTDLVIQNIKLPSDVYTWYVLRSDFLTNNEKTRITLPSYTINDTVTFDPTQDFYKQYTLKTRQRHKNSDIQVSARFTEGVTFPLLFGTYGMYGGSDTTNKLDYLFRLYIEDIIGKVANPIELNLLITIRNENVKPIYN